MKQQFFASALAVVMLAGMAGCAQINDAGLAIFSSTLPTVAVVDAQLLQGEIQLFPDHTGTVTLRSGGAPDLGAAALTSCMGRLRYTSTTTGAIDLRCNGGVTADLKITLLGDTRGYGYGPTATGMASLTFGLSASETRAHLLVPANRKLVDHADSSYVELK